MEWYLVPMLLAICVLLAIMLMLLLEMLLGLFIKLNGQIFPDSEWPRYYSIWTNANCKGGNVSMRIDNQSGSVIKFGVVHY